MRGIIIAGRWAAQSRADEAVLDESAAQELDAHVGSVLELRGYRPSQMQQVLNGSTVPPQVVLGGVRVTGIIRIPTDLTENFAADADVTYAGQGDVFTTAAFYQKYGASVGGFLGMSFQLKQGAAGLPAFEAQVKRLAGGNAQVELGADDNAAAGAFAQRGTTLEALALLVFAIIVALALLVVVGQSLARQAYAAVGDFPALRSLGATPRQLTAVALAPGALVAVAGMALAIPVAYLLSWFTPIGLARRAEISPGFAFDAAAMLGGAAVLALLLAGRAALAAPRAARTGARAAAADRPRAWTGGAAGGPGAVPGRGVGHPAGVRAWPRPGGRPGPRGDRRDGGGAGRGAGGAGVRVQRVARDRRPGGGRLGLGRDGRQPALR